MSISVVYVFTNNGLNYMTSKCSI